MFEQQIWQVIFISIHFLFFNLNENNKTKPRFKTIKSNKIIVRFIDLFGGTLKTPFENLDILLNRLDLIAKIQTHYLNQTLLKFFGYDFDVWFKINV